MDKEFHFHVTYTAAMAAGFPQPDALLIACAARYVDEDPATFHSTWTLAVDNMWDSLADDYSMVIKLLNVWPVFHFLPGKFGKIAGEVRFDLAGSRDCRFSLAPLLICGTESDLTQSLVGGALAAYAGEATREYKLIRIGIAMHTLADTFAHQGFAGLPLGCINEVKNVKSSTIHTNLHQELYFPGINDFSPAPSSESFGYLGHGRIGHLPDRPGAVFHYRAAWHEPTKDPYITRFNPLEFFCAYIQMLEAMRAILAPDAAFPNLADRNGVMVALRAPGTSIVEPYILAFANAPEDKNLLRTWYQTLAAPHVGLAPFGAVDPTFTVAPTARYTPLDADPVLLAEFKRAAADQATLIITSSQGLGAYIDHLETLQK